MINQILKQATCDHEDRKCITNFYGDMIHEVSTRKKIIRSMWICENCGKMLPSEFLDPTCAFVNYERKPIKPFDIEKLTGHPAEENDMKIVDQRDKVEFTYFGELKPGAVFTCKDDKTDGIYRKIHPCFPDDGRPNTKNANTQNVKTTEYIHCEDYVKVVELEATIIITNKGVPYDGKN